VAIVISGGYCQKFNRWYLGGHSPLLFNVSLKKDVSSQPVCPKGWRPLPFQYRKGKVSLRPIFLVPGSPPSWVPFEGPVKICAGFLYNKLCGGVLHPQVRSCRLVVGCSVNKSPQSGALANAKRKGEWKPPMCLQTNELCLANAKLGLPVCSGNWTETPVKNNALPGCGPNGLANGNALCGIGLVVWILRPDCLNFGWNVGGKETKFAWNLPQALAPSKNRCEWQCKVGLVKRGPPGDCPIELVLGKTPPVLGGLGNP